MTVTEAAFFLEEVSAQYMHCYLYAKPRGEYVDIHFEQCPPDTMKADEFVAMIVDERKRWSYFAELAGHAPKEKQNDYRVLLCR